MSTALVTPPVCNTCSQTPAAIPGPPGNQGAPGANGTNGLDAVTTTIAQFTMPALGANVVVPVFNSRWLSVGQNVFVQFAGYMQVAALPTGQSVQLTNISTGSGASDLYPGNAVPGTVIPVASTVSAAGIAGPTIALVSGQGLLLNGVATILTPAVGVNSRIFLQRAPTDGSIAVVAEDVPSRVAGVSFKVISSVGTDNQPVNWFLQ